MPSLFTRRRSSIPNAPDGPPQPINSSIYSTAASPSRPSDAEPSTSIGDTNSQRRGSVSQSIGDVNGPRRGSVSGGGTKIDNLKAKMAVGKSKGISFLQTGSSSLNLSTDGMDGPSTAAAKGAGARRGSLGGYRMGVASNSTVAVNENAGRRGSTSGPASAYKPNAVTTISPPPRPSVNLLDADDSPAFANGAGSSSGLVPSAQPAFARTWAPLQPERRITGGGGDGSSPYSSGSPNRITTSVTEFTQPKRKETPPPLPPSSTKPISPSVPPPIMPATLSMQGAPPPSATLPSPSAQSPPLPPDRIAPRGPRPTPGNLVMPPPPSLVSRKSTMGTNGRPMGLSIVPPTPVPRPIANLPTLNGTAGGGAPRNSFEDYGLGGTMTPRATTPRTSMDSNRSGMTQANGQASAASAQTGHRTAPQGGNAPIRGMSTAGAQLDLRVGPSPLGSPNAAASEPVGRPEARRQRSVMPVMLREPSQRVIHPVDDGGNVGDSNSDSDDDSDSSSQGGSDDDGNDSSATETEDVPRRYGGNLSRGEGSLVAVGAKGLLSKARRGSKGVGSIAEEGEGSASARNQPGGMSERRQAPNGGLGKLPGVPASPRHGQQNSSVWGLPTPKTPNGPSAQWNFDNPPSPAAGWTQFGAQTPSGTPGPSPFSKPVKSPIGNFTMPAGVAMAAAIAKGQQTPAAKARPASGGYFDAAQVSAPSDGGPEQTQAPMDSRALEVSPEIHTASRFENDDLVEGEVPQSLAISHSTPANIPALLANQDTNLGGALPPPPTPLSTGFFVQNVSTQVVEVPFQSGQESGATPRQASIALPSNAYPSPTTIANPTDNRPIPAEITPEVLPVETPLTGNSSRPGNTPQRPSFYSRPSRSAVNLHAEGDPEDDDRVDPAFAAAVRERMSGGTDNISPLPSARNSLDISSNPVRPSPSRKPSALDWTLPPPTPGVGMKQPFNFNSVGSPRVDSIKRSERGSPMKPGRNDTEVTRRKSMTELKEAAPPGYTFPVGATQALIRPREEEGREPLPVYWCSVHIEGYLPRKMEFSTPGVQSKDRAWKRIYVVLHGTSLSVYKHDPHKFPVRDADNIAIDQGDVDNLHVHVPGERRLPVANPVAGARRPSVEPSAAVAGRRPSVAGSDQIMSAGTRRASNASNLSSSVSSASTNSDKDASLFAYTPDRAAAAARRPSVSVPPPQPDHKSAKELAAQLHFGGGNQLVKRYSLQNAESGLASDYKKRTNVVRVRVEGEQFLLHTEGPKDVVDWIEAFQAATNVSLDLDVRPMPKIITLPRRRRRRPAGEEQPAAVAANDDTPEGNARAVEQAERAQRETRLNAMDRALAEDQAHQ